MHRPFRWFEWRLSGLLSLPDTLLFAHFRDDDNATPEGDEL